MKPDQKSIKEVLKTTVTSKTTYICITGSAVAMHSGKAHVQSQWERANFDPNNIKIPEIFQI